ncbi:unnamed protein product [Urochloa humidicola]
MSASRELFQAAARSDASASQCSSSAALLAAGRTMMRRWRRGARDLLHRAAPGLLWSCKHLIKILVPKIFLETDSEHPGPVQDGQLICEDGSSDQHLCGMGDVQASDPDPSLKGN